MVKSLAFISQLFAHWQKARGGTETTCKALLTAKPAHVPQVSKLRGLAFISQLFAHWQKARGGTETTCKALLTAKPAHVPQVSKLRGQCIRRDGGKYNTIIEL
ncbi:hypothetical protein IRJ41_009713 [Triplophysa rosa]|uniref:Uncharacterized protein n=1 Tax=Triplophysa rosa TaxID=992332 RepID=A0A9W7TD68_TRIRA|nr:hypothetical protein IRJ41_009713 [Triplophysa rosa]